MLNSQTNERKIIHKVNFKNERSKSFNKLEKKMKIEYITI